VKRVCFLLQVRPERLDEYVVRHGEVWDEMLAALRAAGWSNYTMFHREDGLVVGYLETESFEAALAAMDSELVNARWQAEMAPFFDLGDRRPDQAMSTLTEFFHLD